ncbi:MAG: cyclic nucleotide-binding domain-containing protein, partial [Rhodocyclaceae bacterium]|nr:cyclic nucleotide-binding domain-containing protein [Rhodocyclaceae bacterium]
QIGLGAAGIGRLIKYIPFPVVSGYLSGVGLIIIGSQIPKFLGAPAGASLLDALRTPMAWMWQGIVVGAVVAAAMIFMPRLTRAVPAAILALLAGIGTYLLLGQLDPALLNTDHNPLLVGALAGGESNFGDAIQQRWTAISLLGFDAVMKVFVPALTLAVLLSIDTLKTCLVIDAMTNSHHDSNRELVGQGLGNIASSLVGGIPGAGTMGASLINISSGGKTRAAGIMAGVFSLAAFLLLSPLIAWVPVSALAAILIVIGFRMIDRHSLAFFFSRDTRLDFFVILAVILVALFGNLIAASGVGVALAILLFIREQTRSSVVRNRIEGHEIFSKRAHTPEELERVEREGSGAVVFELQGSLFFGTASQLQAALEPETDRRKYVILSMRRVQSLDVTATHVLEQIKDRLEENNAYLVFCDIPKGLPSGLKMKRFLKETGVVRPTNKAFAFRQLDEALEWVETHAKEEEGVVDEADTRALDLRAMPIFAGCAPDAMAALEAAVGLRTIKAGKKVFKAGAGDEAIFLIRRGTVKVTLPIHKKESYHLATSGPGDLMGGMGFIEKRGHAADAVAVTETEVYVLSRDSFNALAELHGALARRILETVALNLATRLRVTIAEVQALRG